MLFLGYNAGQQLIFIFTFYFVMFKKQNEMSVKWIAHNQVFSLVVIDGH